MYTRPRINKSIFIIKYAVLSLHSWVSTIQSVVLTADVFQIFIKFSMHPSPLWGTPALCPLIWVTTRRERGFSCESYNVCMHQHAPDAFVRWCSCFCFCFSLFLGGCIIPGTQLSNWPQLRYYQRTSISEWLFCSPEVFFHSCYLWRYDGDDELMWGQQRWDRRYLCWPLCFALLSPNRDVECSIAADVNISVCTKYVFVCHGEVYHRLGLLEYAGIHESCLLYTSDAADE